MGRTKIPERNLAFFTVGIVFSVGLVVAADEPLAGSTNTLTIDALARNAELKFYESKLREMRRWRPDAAQHFSVAAELADRHYRLGAVPVSIYVELQKPYLEAVEVLFDTRKETLEAAARLELLTGLSCRSQTQA